MALLQLNQELNIFKFNLSKDPQNLHWEFNQLQSHSNSFKNTLLNKIKNDYLEAYVCYQLYNIILITFINVKLKICIKIMIFGFIIT